MRAAFLECHLDRALWGRIFLRVIEEDLDDLLQVLWRAVDRDAVGDVLRERQALFEEECVKGEQLVRNEARQVDGLQRHLLDGTAVDTSELQEALDEATHLVRHREDILDELRLMRFIEARRFQHLRIGQDDGERCLQLMGGVGNELPLLCPGFLDRAYRPAREEDADDEEAGEAAEADDDAGPVEVLHRRDLGGDIHEDDDLAIPLPRAASIVAEIIVAEVADLFFTGGRRADELLEDGFRAFLRQIIVVAIHVDDLPIRVDQNTEERKQYVHRLVFVLPLRIAVR